MIDLIIPYYNNSSGLKQTLASITSDLFYITIVDDSSSVTPWRPKVHQVLRYNKNHGPGYARQFGLDRTHNEWIMFIDTGDIFVSQTSFDEISSAIKENSEADIISFPYFYKEKTPNESSNRLHGKIYKRSFLEKFNITFPLETSYMNEDIGFNRACKLCTKNIIYKNIPIIKWVNEENSLTNKNNNAVLYRDQTRALSLATIHVIDICNKNNISVEEEINQIAVALYYWFIRTAAERKEFIQDAWSGAKIFYDKFGNQIKQNQLVIGNVYLKKALQFRDKINFPINILRFVDEIQKNKIIPNKYLTLN